MNQYCELLAKLNLRGDSSDSVDVNDFVTVCQVLAQKIADNAKAIHDHYSLEDGRVNEDFDLQTLFKLIGKNNMERWKMLISIFQIL